jgi:Domain of unknown function (DUF4410)
MKPDSRLVSCLFVVVVIAGCASTKVTDRQILVTERIPRPDHILVHDFVATLADVPADSALAGASTGHGTPQTAKRIATGRRVGAEIAARLVEEIRNMGLPAERASTRATPKINDIVIRGYLLSIEEGSAAKRVAIGFGAGASQLSVAVEGYQMTAEGLRKLGSGTVDSGGSKGPGVAVAVATGNPLGLIVSGGMKAYGEVSGSSKIEGRAEQTAKKIAEELKPRFRRQGWIK